MDCLVLFFPCYSSHPKIDPLFDGLLLWCVGKLAKALSPRSDSDQLEKSIKALGRLFG